MLYAVFFQIIYEKTIWPKNTFILSLIFIKLVSFTGTFIISSGCSLLICMFLFYFIFLAEMISFSFYCRSASKKLRNSLPFCLSGNNLTWLNVAFLINNLSILWMSHCFLFSMISGEKSVFPYIEDRSFVQDEPFFYYLRVSEKVNVDNFASVFVV